VSRAKRPPAPPSPPVCVQLIERHGPGLSAVYFGLPVYLVGGALTDPDPRDLDVVIILPDDLFAACYGDWGPLTEEHKKAGFTVAEREVGLWCRGTLGRELTPVWRRWARDCAKHNRSLSRQVGRRVDFKTQVESIAKHEHEGKPRRRIDGGVGG
jgi:hypothetical protein